MAAARFDVDDDSSDKQVAVDMDIHGWIYPSILRWHNTIALNLCKIPASYKLLTNCTFFNVNLF